MCVVLAQNVFYANFLIPLNKKVRISNNYLCIYGYIPVLLVKLNLGGTRLLHFSVNLTFPISTMKKINHPMYNQFIFSSSLTIHFAFIFNEIKLFISGNHSFHMQNEKELCL